MRAIINTPAGSDPIRLDVVEDPSPAPDQALIRVSAMSVNRGELALLAARPDGWRPGQDIAGVVDRAADDGSGPAAGSPVIGLVEQAGWAELVAAPTDRLASVDRGTDLTALAGLPLAGLTALRTLRYGGDLLGKRVLVTGAGGAVGRLQVELAHRHGAHVTAVADSDRATELTAIGADAIVTDPSASGTQYDLITESVGGSSLADAITALAPGGDLVLFGASTGEKTPLSLYDFINHENATVHVFLSYASPQPFAPDLQRLADLVPRDLLHPHVGLALPWTDAAHGLKALADRTTRGKLVLTLA